MKIPYLLLFTLLLGNCQSQQSAEELSAESFHKAIADREEAIIIDVRTEKELSRGMIEGAINMDVRSPDFKERAARLDKNQDYYVYCLSGGRSAQAARYLQSIGIQNVVNLRGGMLAWQKSGLPVVGTNDIPDKISGDMYNQLIRSNEKVLVDFYAPWCAPCVRMEPMLDELQEEKSEELKIVRINIEENKRLVKALGVFEIPAFKYFVSGEEKWQYQGEFTKEKLVEKL